MLVSLLLLRFLKKSNIKTFCHELENLQVDIKSIQRKISRSLRLNNPLNIIKGALIKGDKKDG